MAALQQFAATTIFRLETNLKLNNKNIVYKSYAYLIRLCLNEAITINEAITWDLTLSGDAARKVLILART